VTSSVVRYRDLGGVAPAGDAPTDAPSSSPHEAPDDGAPGVPPSYRPLCDALWALSAVEASVDGDRVRLSVLGGPDWPLPWRELGYRKMKAYVQSASAAGVVEVGPDGDTMPWCRLAPRTRRLYEESNPDRLRPRGPTQRVVSTARALLLGIGADETLGGYGRHRTTFQRGGEEALRTELEMDFSRLWRRNLGRDDRVISDRGKESRLPFLAEGVLAVLRTLPLAHCCNLTLPPGVGDKRLLRAAGRTLGLTASMTLQKRAIQFGTRIANRRLDGARKWDGTAPLATALNPRVVVRTEDD